MHNPQADKPAMFMDFAKRADEIAERLRGLANELGTCAVQGEALPMPPTSEITTALSRLTDDINSASDHAFTRLWRVPGPDADDLRAPGLLDLVSYQPTFTHERGLVDIYIDAPNRLEIRGHPLQLGKFATLFINVLGTRRSHSIPTAVLLEVVETLPDESALQKGVRVVKDAARVTERLNDVSGHELIKRDRAGRHGYRYFLSPNTRFIDRRPISQIPRTWQNTFTD
jgi:hypothetical protein